MFCKWCGLESDTTDVCSWCRRPFSVQAKAPAQVQQSEAPAVAPEPQPPVAPPAQAPDIVKPSPVPYDSLLDEDLSPVPFSGTLAEPGTSESAAVVEAPPMPAQPPRIEPKAQIIEPPAVSRGTEAIPIRKAPQAEAIPIRKPSAPQAEPIPIRKPSAPPDAVPPARSGPPATRAEPSRSESEMQPFDLAPPKQERVAPPPVALPLKPSPAPVVNREPEPPAPRPVGPEPRSRPLTEPMIHAEPEGPPVLDLPALDLPEIGPDDDEPIVAGGKRIDLTGAPTALPVGLAGPRPAPGPPPTFARVPTPSTTKLPKAGGLTWYCRWCGMESETPDRCSWCKRDLRNLPAGGSGKGPVIAGNKHSGPRGARRPMPPTTPPARGNSVRPTMQPVGPVVSAGGGAAAVAAPTAPVAAAAVKAATAPVKPKNDGVPAMGAFQAQKSKYYADQVIDPVSGRHYDAETGQTTDTPIELKEDIAVNEQAEQLKQTAIYMAGLVAAIVVGVLFVRALPYWYLLFLAVSNVAAGMAMPVLRVVPFGEDDSSDVPWAIPLILILGPIVGGMAYGVVAVMRTDANPAIVGIIVSYLLLRFPLQFAAGTGVAEALQSLMPVTPPPNGDWGTHLALQWLPFATMIGWYMAAVFHKPDE